MRRQRDVTQSQLVWTCECGSACVSADMLLGAAGETESVAEKHAGKYEEQPHKQS